MTRAKVGSRLFVLLSVGVLLLAACGLRRGRGPDRTPPAATLAVVETSTLAPATDTAPPATATTAPTQPPATLAATLAPTSAALDFAIGRNDYVIDFEATPRKFLVYVPAGYDPSRPTPVVFMFHGSNQGGPLMYENTAWAAKADQENFIVVYPTSWKYFLTTEGRVSDKWHVPSLSQIVEPGTALKNDVGFVRVMLDRLRVTFNVDESRLYATGFSNGGAFVMSRLMIQMSDVFAAFAASGAGLFGEGRLAEPITGLDASLYSVVGTNDEKLAEGQDYPLPFPFLPEAVAADPVFQQVVANTTGLLSLATTYTSVVEQPGYSTLTFDTSLVGADNQYVLRMVHNMGHVYPNGTNNRHDLNVSDLFWDFFVQYSL